MLNKIENLLKQMSKSEQTDFYLFMKHEYCLEEKEGMLRDDISDKVVELLFGNFAWLESVKPEWSTEEKTFVQLQLDTFNVSFLCSILVEAFGLEPIDVSVMKSWTKVKDIVDYIEDNLGEV